MHALRQRITAGLLTLAMKNGQVFMIAYQMFDLTAAYGIMLSYGRCIRLSNYAATSFTITFLSARCSIEMFFDFSLCCILSAARNTSCYPLMSLNRCMPPKTRCHLQSLARIIHEASAATAGPGMSAVLRSVGFLDVLSSTPAESSRRAPCIHARLRRLATNLHE